MRNFIKNKKSLVYFYASILLLFIWFISSLIVNNEYLIPKISAVLYDVYVILGNISNLFAIFETFSRLFIASFIALFIAFLVMLVYLRNRNIYFFLKPYLAMLKTIPLVSIMVILLVWFGDENSPIIITILIVLPITIEGIISGIDQMDKNLIDELKMLNLNFFKLVKLIYLPLLRPYILMSLLQTIGLGVKVMIMSELICQTTNSIGNMMYFAKMTVDTKRLFAWSLIVVFIVMIIEMIITKYKNQFVKEIVAK